MKNLKQALIWLIIVSPAGFTYSQYKYDPDSLRSIIKEEKIKEEFVKLFSPANDNGIGNYASFDVIEGKAEFSGNIVMRNFTFMGKTTKTAGDIFGVKVTGAITDKTVSLFNNNEWNSNIGIDLKYNLFLGRNRSLSEKMGVKNDIQFYDKSLDACIEGYALAQKKHDEKDLYFQEQIIELKMQERLFTNTLSYKNNVVADKIKKRDSVNMVNPTSTEGYQLSLEIIKDSIDLLKAKSNLKSTQKALETLQNESATTRDYNAIYQRNTSINTLKMKLIPIGISVRWISFGISAKNNSFKRYYQDNFFDDQFSDTAYLSTKINIRYNILSKGKHQKTNFLSFGYAASISDNFAALSKQDFVETTSLSSGSSIRNKTKKFTAYSGEYNTEIITHIFDINWYSFFTGNTMAIHLFPTHIVRENFKPETNLGVGILIPFQNKVKGKDLVNAELYMNAINLFENNRVSNPSVFKRSEYGLRFTIPISFNL